MSPISPAGHDIDRKLRPVGAAYQALIEEFGPLDVVPNEAFLALM